MRVMAAVRRTVCLALSAAVLIAAPGLGPWQAAAQTAPTPVKIVTPVGGLNIGGAAGAAISGNGLQNTKSPLSLPGFSGSINTLVSPTDIPTPALTPNAARSAAPAAALALPVSAIANPAAAQSLPNLRPSGGGMQPAAFQAPAFFRERALSAETDGPAAALGGVSAAQASKAEPDVRAQVGEVAQVKDGEALQTVRGQSHNLSQRFEELRRFFSESKDAADLRSDQRALGDTQGASSSEAQAQGASVVDAARGWISRIPFLGRRVIETPASEAGLALDFQAEAGKATPAALSLKTGPVHKPALAPETSAKDSLALPDSAIPGSKNVLASPASSESAAARPAQEKRSALGKVAWWFIGSLLVAQVGVEALGSSMPTLVQKAFGDFTVVAQLAVFSSIAGIIGRQLGPMIVDKFGIKKAYVGSMLLRLVSISALIGLLATGHITLPLMIGFYSVNALLNGVTLTAMNSIPPLLVGQGNSELERFWSVQHTLVEIIGIAGPIATGIVVSSFGFIPALIAFPVASLASALIVWKTLSLPAESELKAAAPATQSQAQTAGVAGVFKAFFQKIGRGAKLVWNDPALRTSFILYSLVMMLNPFLYQMIAPGFALRLVGAAAPELATSIGGWLTGLYSAGGLLGALLMTMEGNRIAKGKAEGRITDEQEKEILRKSLSRWLLLGTAGLALLGTLALPLPTLGTMVALPSFLAWASGLTLPALALIPFGIAQVISTLKLQSFFQARVPRKEDMADAMGFLGSASLAVTTVGIVGLKYLFKAALGMTPFVYISAALIPLALAYLYLRWKLSKV